MQEKRGDAKVTSKKRIGIAVPMELYEELKDAAGYSGQTLNGLLLQILWKWREKKGMEVV